MSGNPMSTILTTDILSYDLITGECDPCIEATRSCEANTRAFFQAAQFGESHLVVVDFEDRDV